MREANSEDPVYKDKYKEALPYLLEITKSKEPCTQYNSYMLLVQVYANVGMSAEALDAIAQRDKLKSEHPECVPKEENK
jgi:predicted Zn-dependent protease